MEFNLNDIVRMKKVHPCGEDKFVIIRTGVDIKIKCLKCGRIIMLPYEEFTKKVKKVITNE